MSINSALTILQFSAVSLLNGVVVNSESGGIHPNITSYNLKVREPVVEYELPFLSAYEGTDVALRCSGDRPVEWEWETVEEVIREEQTKRFAVTDNEMDLSSSFLYWRELQISSAKFSDTGTFICRYKETETVSEIYLFVESREELFRRDKYFTQVYVDKHQPTYLGCRPSSNRVEMKIFNQRSIDITDNLEDSNLVYTPQTGLWIKEATVPDAGIRTCQASLDNSEDSKQIMYLNIIDTPSPGPNSPPPKPRISAEIPPGPEVGGNLTLTCSVSVTVHDYVSGVTLVWGTPSGTQKKDIAIGRVVIGEDIAARVDTGQNMGFQNDMRAISRNITVHNLTSLDEGLYTCTVNVSQLPKTSRQSKRVQILHPGGVFISNFSFGGGGGTISINGPREEVQWLFDVEAVPRNQSNHNWFLPSGEMVPDQQLEKYSKIINGNNIKLTIKDVSIYDMGTYPFVVSVLSDKGYNESKSTELGLIVRQTPKLNISVANSEKSTQFYQKQEFYEISCEALGFPIDKESVSLHFYPCSSFNSCDTSQPRRYNPGPLQPIDSVLNPDLHYRFRSNKMIQATESGKFECRVCAPRQTTVCNSVELPFFLSESKTGLDILYKKNKEYIEEDTLNLTCAASKYLYRSVDWSYGDELIVSTALDTDLSHLRVLTVQQLSLGDHGDYICTGHRFSGQSDTVTQTVEVLEIIPPEVEKTNMKESVADVIKKPAEDEFDFICDVRGRPDPNIVWYKDGDVINQTDIELFNGNRLIKLHDNKRRLRLQYLRGKDSGLYTCKATNRGGELSLSLELVVLEPPDHTAMYLAIGCSIGGLILITSISAAIWNIVIYQRKLRLLTAAELQMFETGDPSSINPDMGVDEQADLLPYNKCMEFPKDRLKLGKQLGSGAFGRVLKADATGINSWEPVSVVAVKMVKPQADITYIKALMSELKIMMHLGKHLNIVNLLGACTVSLNRRELYVIVEYCRFGNLQKYLIRHRNSYVSQTDPNTGLIDFNIGKYHSGTVDDVVDYTRDREVYENSAHYVASNNFIRSASEFDGTNQPEGYIDMRSPAVDGITEFQFPRQKSVRYTKEPYLMQKEINSAGGEEILASDMTQITNVPNTGGTEERDSRSYSVGSRLSKTGPGWRSNMKGDYRSQEVKPLTTKDLICWAYQIARGMDYLSSKKVMHGDLACRNILLAADNVVKICDFGLAKDIYKTNNYHKKTDGPLPVKWLAVECLRDRIFSTQSDVWAFGIVLWEMFSLGKTPYPGIEAGERFYEMLVKGYRMPKPHYAPRDLYKTMLDCWDSDPVRRPRFVELTGIFGDLLEEGERENYIIMSDRIEEEGAKMEGTKQYLEMMSQPDYQKIVNGNYECGEDNGYLIPNRRDEETGEENGYLVPNTTISIEKVACENEKENLLVKQEKQSEC